MADPTPTEGAGGSANSTINDLYDMVQHPLVKFGIGGVSVRKEWNEGSAAAERQRLDRSIRNHVDPTAKGLSKVLDSGNTTIKAYENGAKAMTATLATTSKVADSIGQNFDTITKSAAQTSGDISNTALAWQKTAERVDESISTLNKNISGVCIMANSMMSGMVQALEEVVKEVRMINHNLEGIKDELRAKNILVSSGGSGPDGFARVVHGFLQLQIKRHSGDGHRFFVWHPDTTWHWRFQQLMEDEPFPPTFCAYTDDLDCLCACMKAARESLPKDSKVTFHLVIPAWYEIQVKVPLHFPDELQPLRIVGPKHGGKELVSFNLPAATTNLLDGIANVLDPEGYNSKATVAAMATGAVVGGFGTQGACFAAGIWLGVVTGLGPIAVIPVGFGLFPTVGAPVAFRAADAVGEMLREEPARILGSDRRLHREGGILES
ncbi:hypothetical protein FOMG_19418 [Fusarium oxysporum f. sp. melonis 26406]|uniref:Uncharacterized protein n=2 Tax=Fusarium oxysporum TaxID=5507 RepID=A0A2H3FQA0_FUSOX|nr:hypothetical protein FOMG_19418 [Fusarium oxysporum f. sp. melonis 26406]PCD21737.1 hypothetical protein AU210_015540 [Fusarium oxysporum f. sp. radicis-cucumerinum]